MAGHPRNNRTKSIPHRHASWYLLGEERSKKRNRLKADAEGQHALRSTKQYDNVLDYNSQRDSNSWTF